MGEGWSGNGGWKCVLFKKLYPPCGAVFVPLYVLKVKKALTAPLIRLIPVKTNTVTNGQVFGAEEFGENESRVFCSELPLLRGALPGSMITQQRSSHSSHDGTFWKRRRHIGRMSHSAKQEWKSSRKDVRWPRRKLRPSPATWCWSAVRWVLWG